ncbi:hypothetical protein KFK09_018832 [Dendrobium nobile]|uniref:Uncharacterized protein n=1 Tax=Dendrobium nobile TaxID=94219 RepID=A0A8T3AX97_DENNO|nr:hypothetical protein KFK09_018832 [Dendrobium nobile]
MIIIIDFMLNSKRQCKTFKVGNSATVRIRPAQFPQGAVKESHARSAGPIKTVKKIIDSAYVVALLAEFNIYPSINIEDLVTYEGLEFNPPPPLQIKPCVTHLVRTPKPTSTPKIYSQNSYSGEG